MGCIASHDREVINEGSCRDLLVERILCSSTRTAPDLVVIRSPTLLQRKLLDPNWRMVPAQFDLPSNSQIFGRSLRT